MAPQQQHMLAWRFILLWLTVSTEMYGLYFSPFLLRLSHYACLLFFLSHALLFFSPCVHLSHLNPSFLSLSTLIALFFLSSLASSVSFTSPLYLKLFVNISTSIPPPPFLVDSSPTPCHSRMKVCKHVFHMQSHCAEPTEQTNHA